MQTYMNIRFMNWQFPISNYDLRSVVCEQKKQNNNITDDPKK